MLFPPTVGELRVAMLFVDFADARGTSDPSKIYETVVPPVAAWYRTVSYGRLELSVTPVRRWISLRGAVAEYTTPDLTEGLRAAIDEAVSVADTELDFSAYEALYLVVPPAVFGTTGPLGVLISERPIRADGASINAWAFLAIDESSGQDAYVTHETGHLLGLPDLYVNRVPRTFHSWDVMAWGTGRLGGMFAWHRWKLGWIEPRQIACFGGRGTIVATVAPVEVPGGVKAVVYRTPTAAYVAEVRARLAEDAAICKPGVLVYKVDFFARSGSDDIKLLQARPEGTLSRRRCGQQPAAAFAIGRREVSAVSAWGLRFELLKAFPDGSYRIRVRRPA